MSLCVMSDYISETKPPILMKLCMVLRYVLIWVYAKFQLILPINKEFLLMSHILGRVAALLASSSKYYFSNALASKSLSFYRDISHVFEWLVIISPSPQFPFSFHHSLVAMNVFPTICTKRKKGRGREMAPIMYLYYKFGRKKIETFILKRK